jgi:hypothetical protein
MASISCSASPARTCTWRSERTSIEGLSLGTISNYELSREVSKYGLYAFGNAQNYMTSTQQKTIVDAQTAFFAAADEKLKQDTIMVTEDNLLAAAQRDANVDAPARAHQVIQDAADILVSVTNERNNQFQNAINANLAYGATQAAYYKAIADSQQTGAVERT